jgi:hypothetical protein
MEIGDEFNQLTFIEFEKNHQGKFLCICGKTKIANKTEVKRGNIKSCGCLKHNNKSSITHGKSNTPLYQTYHQILKRCYNPNSSKYKDYGDRGIKVSKEWLDNFMNFYNWAIQNGWKKGLTIERKDVNGDYCSENCKWIPNTEQPKNRRNNVKITAWGETKNLADWARDSRCIVSENHIIPRIKNGMSPEQAISTRKRKYYVLRAS